MTRIRRLTVAGFFCACSLVLACVMAWRESEGSGGPSGREPPRATGGTSPGGEQVAGTLVKKPY